MLLQRNRSLLIIFALLAVLIFSGCASQQPTDETSAELEKVQEVEEVVSLISAFEVLQSDDRELLTYVHGDHWDGAMPFIQEGDHLEVNVRVEDSAGKVIYPDDTALSLDVQIVDDAEDIVSFDFTGDHFLIEGNKPGETRILFSLQQDGEVVFQTPPLPVHVAEKVADAEPVEVPEVYSYNLVDRSQDKVTANVHGNHWDGSLPPVTNGEYISVGAEIKDTQGQIILLDGQPFSSEARISDQAQEGLVSFDFHGDHLYIIGEAPGDTHLVFMLIANNEPVFETPPIAVKIVD